MKRFILISFLLLGVAFYELSGGNDFDPEAARLAAMEDRLERDLARRSENGLVTAGEIAARPRPAPAATPARAVEPISLSLSRYSDVAGPSAQQIPSLPRIVPPSQANDALPQTRSDTDESLSAFVARSGLRESIAFPGRSTVASSEAALESDDFRRVRGTLVNLRSGPGTDFGVVDQLEQDTRVEVLTDNGDGWVELRAVESGSTGWIASFLLTAD